jgi:hypothetical protein
VDEAKEQIFVQLSPGAKPQDLEISTRNTLFKATGKKNLIIVASSFATAPTEWTAETRSI